MEQTSGTRETYYRTGCGSHRHGTYYCANHRRSIFTGETIEMTAAEAEGWAPCEVCLPDEAAAHVAPPAPARCPNRGVVKPQRMYSNCRDCGKEGKVNRSTGNIKAHAPAA